MFGEHLFAYMNVNLSEVMMLSTFFKFIIKYSYRKITF